ncbi:MAG: 16S rRNA (cytidine(1402)-2'-O)-methyltransferase, partial [Candidatus Competibacterales bacterium]|nr:16S rRNA (cytidine(1402)-2'-O)-methyltransferase [Candidatus Competibacterales bacterium]
MVATPIGNLDDIGHRALTVLTAVDWIAAEDTRHSARLLAHYGIATPLRSLHEHNEQARVPQLLAELRSGRSGALISDAGTPLISDPGFPLLRALRREGLAVRAVPGPSSVLAALSIAGLPCERFTFEGFLPARREARRQRLAALREHPCTLVLFEAGRRVVASLGDMVDLLGADRPACIARELTKAFEESHTATLAELRDWLQARETRCRGEFVLVVQAVPQQAPDLAEQRRVRAALLRGLPLKRARALAGELSGARRHALDTLALA